MDLAIIDCSTTDTGQWTSNNEPATMGSATIVSRRTDLATMYSATMYIATLYSATMDTATMEHTQWSLQ